MSQTRQIATAFHEASHAVAAISLGIRLRKRGISIERDEDSRGRAYVHKALRTNSELKATDAQRVKAEKDVIVYFAGYEGQRIFCPRSRGGYGRDHQDAATLMCHFAGSEREVDAYMKLLQIRTEQLLSMEHIQTKIKAVAEALVEHKKLSAAEVEAIVWGV
jgi:hypothetical protein